MAVRPARPRSEGPLILRGLAASPGIGLGVAVLFDPDVVEVEERDLVPGEIEGEVTRFGEAIAAAREEVRILREATADEMGEEPARIFDAHLTILEDTMAVDDTIAAIRAEGKNAAFVFKRNILRIAEHMERLGDEVFRQRAVDVLDVKRRVLRKLVNAAARALPSVHRDAVLVAHDLAPSDIATLRPGQVAGFATELGGMTSHVAIMARSRGIPAVVGLRSLVENVRPGEPVIVDGIKGLVEVNPRAEIVESYRGKQLRLQEMEHLHAENRELEATTLDGFTLSLGANLELPEEVEFARERGARAIGLFRTEFFFMTHSRMPAEEEQLRAYDAVAARMHPLPVIIRTLDVGGDKVASYLGTTRERNPFYGLRGIRFLIEHRDLFKTQLRAIFRASARGNVKVMFPMIAGLEEIRISRDLVDEVRQELTAEGRPFDAAAEIGIMVEVPSAVLMADRLAREVDFFSIGSNDLIQYTLAVDRTNEKTAHLYDPFHPAFLRAVDMTAKAARGAGAWAGICGEITSDPLFIPLLIGLGFDELSTSPYYIPEIKAVIRSFRKKDAEEIAAEALQFSTSAKVRAFLKEKVNACLPELESLIPGKENHGG